MEELFVPEIDKRTDRKEPSKKQTDGNDLLQGAKSCQRGAHNLTFSRDVSRDHTGNQATAAGGTSRSNPIHRRFGPASSTDWQRIRRIGRSIGGIDRSRGNYTAKISHDARFLRRIVHAADSPPQFASTVVRAFT